MDANEIGIRLELLKLAKDITEVNSITEQPAGRPGQAGQGRFYPQYSVDQVLATARRLYEFVTADEKEMTAN